MNGEPSILVLNQVAGRLTWELVEDLAERVGRVGLLTGDPDTLAKSKVDEILVTQAAPYVRGSYRSRIASWLHYLWHGWRWVRRFPAETPLLLFSNPPFAPWLGWLLFRLRGQRYAVMIYDIYPDLLTGLRAVSPRNPLVRVWQSINQRAYQRATLVMTIGEMMADRLQRQCPGRTIEVVLPWADTDWIRPRPKNGNPFAWEHGLEKRMTVMYSGNMGLAHDIETVLTAAESLRARNDLRFVFIGAGPKWQLVDDEREIKGLQNLILLGWQPEEVLPYSLAAADIGIVAMENGVEGLAIPSKAFSFLAAGVPLALISSRNSELASIIEQEACGWVIDPGDSERLAELVGGISREDLKDLRSNSRRTAEALGSRANSRAMAQLLAERLLTTG